MKKLYKITPYVMLGLMVAGCTDLDTEPLSSTITSDQKEEVVESDPSRLEASVAAVAANFTQYAKIYTEDDNVHSDIGSDHYAGHGIKRYGHGGRYYWL